jgi:hypothetical protein
MPFVTFSKDKPDYSNLEYCPTPAYGGGPLNRDGCVGACDDRNFGAVRISSRAQHAARAAPFSEAAALGL